MRLYYHDTPRPGNFGDILNKWLVEEISGRKVVKSPPANNVHICIGSIIKYASDKMHVWGTGAMWQHDKPSPTAYYHAVRGPLTRDVVLRNGGDCPEIYGDPALLLPQFFNPEVPKKYKLGIIPHYVDYKAVKQAFPQHKVINLINADPLAVVKEILQCEAIVSSSLHGIIAAQAYGVPAAWVQTIEGKLSGDGTKFRD
jgi:pyruvyltransferase